MNENANTIEEISNSILNSIKKMFGQEPDNTDFDLDIMFNINEALAVLTQLGLGHETGYSITGPEDTYEDFLVDSNPTITSYVKMYIYYSVKMGFDTSTTSSTVLEHTKEKMEEILIRLQYIIETAD